MEKNYVRENHSLYMNKGLSKAIMLITQLRNTFLKNRSVKNKKATIYKTKLVFHFCKK